MESPEDRDPPKRAKDTRRLTRQDWVDAAVRVMAESGVEQVRVERLAVALGASKGSFYWHFKDRQALLDAVLEAWRLRQTVAVQARLALEAPEAQLRIQRLMALPLASDAAAGAAEFELAIMMWARRSPEARAAVQAVDEARIAYLEELFATLGCEAGEAQWRAHRAYALVRYVAQRGDLSLAQRQAMVTRACAELTSETQVT